MRVVPRGNVRGNGGRRAVARAARRSEECGQFDSCRVHRNAFHFHGTIAMSTQPPDTVTVDLAKVDAAPPAMPFFAKGSSASRAAFAGFESGWGTEDFKARKYPAPAAQYVVYLDGLMSVITSDGQTRQFKAGDVLRVEDLAPCKGHISVVVGDRTSYAMVVR